MKFLDNVETLRAFQRPWPILCHVSFRRSLPFSVEVVGNRTNVKVSWPPFFVGDDPSGGSTGDAAASPSARTKIFERLYFEHCGETTDQIRMPFGIIGRTGPGIRQGLGIGPREGVLLGANLGRAIVTNGYFTAYVYTFAATRPSSQITLGLL